MSCQGGACFAPVSECVYRSAKFCKQSFQCFVGIDRPDLLPHARLVEFEALYLPSRFDREFDSGEQFAVGFGVRCEPFCDTPATGVGNVMGLDN